MNTVHPLWLEVFVDLWDPTVNQISNVLTLETFVSFGILFVYLHNELHMSTRAAGCNIIIREKRFNKLKKDPKMRS